MIQFFIRRPIFASVCSVIVLLLGLVSLPGLPVELYPQLAPPQVTVNSFYVGASAEVVESAVTVPLEQQINGVEGMQHISSSSSSNGTSEITVTFDLDRDVDIAAVDVQNRVSAALPQLPAEVKATGVFVNKNTNQFVLAAGLYSENDQYDPLFLSNYADIYMRDALKRVKGVGNVLIFGERRFSMRLWLDPMRMAARGLTAMDVVNALREQNVQVAAGQVGQPPAPAGQGYQFSIRAEGRLREPAQFEDIILKTGEGGSLVRLKDVGRAELGAEDYSSVLRFNGHRAVGVGVLQLPGANSLEVSRDVRAELERLSARFPPGMKLRFAFDTTEAVNESIFEVEEALLIAILLVIVVMYVFLQGLRTTLIPTITIPVSLLGTFMFVKVFGFSINTLTLFGLTLAVGLVVDDAIVVIENIQRHMDEYKRSSVEAARTGMTEVFGAVVATSLVLVAVFVPVALFPGTTGRIYQQFALTLAFAVALSLFNSLTLTPALSALLLRPMREQKGWFFRKFDAGMDALYRGYGRVLRALVARRVLVLGGFALSLVATWLVFRAVPTGFIPDEDQGYVIISMQGPEGMSLAQTEKVLVEMEKVLNAQPEVNAMFVIGGFS
ncbi:MAG TPA: efflux RND transporter permease subunit, partial [Myxococcaceae bacterium]|nr:efflux RND transporter permease subunit [Myxococcaceae bacterium]